MCLRVVTSYLPVREDSELPTVWAVEEDIIKINATKMGMAAALAFAIVWVICSLLVWIFPAVMMNMSGHMVHGDLSTMTWHMSVGGLLTGLIVWSVLAGFIAWLIATVYNRLV